MKVIVLGANGMLGHVVSTYFKERGHDVIDTSRDKNSSYYYDVFENVYSIKKIINDVQPTAIINCIGILNQAAEQNHAVALMVNSFFPNYLDLLSQKYNFKLVHITTDCVFDGKTGNYTEDSIPNAISFYGRTKALGEVNNNNTLTLRLSIVGPDINENGIGLFNWFSKQSGIVKGYSKVYWSGVTTVELSRIIEDGIVNNVSGLNNVSNNKKITKADLLRLFEKYFNFGINIIDDLNYESDKSLICSNKSYNFKVPSYEEMIKNMKDWVDTHEYLYPFLRRN